MTVPTGGDLPARSTIHVTGTGAFDDGLGLRVVQCYIRGGIPDRCAENFDVIVPGPDGRFSGDVLLSAVFSAGNDDVDCRKDQCGIAVLDDALTPIVVPVQFAASPPSRGRYLDPVFNDVRVSKGIVYRSTTTAAGQPIDLAPDVYQPQGDHAPQRGAMLLLHAGYFSDGSREDPDMQALGMAFARRGYVAVSADYRLRPNAATNLDELIAATHDARDDAIGAMGWIQHHADALRIDPAAVVATGYSAGAVIALNLAYDQRIPRPPESVPGAAVVIAGILFTPASTGGPPTQFFTGNQDGTIPAPTQIGSCQLVRHAGNDCSVVFYAKQQPPAADDSCTTLAVPCTYVFGADRGHDLMESERPDIIERTSRFLYDTVIAPRRLVHALPRRLVRRSPTRGRPRGHSPPWRSRALWS